MLLITYKLDYWNAFCIYICMSMYVRICLSINLPVYLHAYVDLETDTHS